MSGRKASRSRVSRFADEQRTRRVHDRRRLEVRKCCSTSWREAHASTCQRPDRCRDKVGYAGRDEAKNACRVRRERYGNVLTEYLCPSCGMYHIGHPLPGQRGWDEATS